MRSRCAWRSARARSGCWRPSWPRDWRPHRFPKDAHPEGQSRAGRSAGGCERRPNRTAAIHREARRCVPGGRGLPPRARPRRGLARVARPGPGRPLERTGNPVELPAEGLDRGLAGPGARGFAGPAVADGRVFVTDFQASGGMMGTERALALDEQSGQVLWTREWDGGLRRPELRHGAAGDAHGRRRPGLRGRGQRRPLCLDARTGA